MQPNEVAMRKRAQIAKANRVMFLWVSAVSVIVGFGLVGAIFLAQKLFFNEKVLAEKDKTVAVLKANNASVAELEAQVRVLDTNQALIDSKAKPTDQPIQAILDALPSSPSKLALGASLQNKLLANINGLTIQSLQVDDPAGVGAEDLGAGTTTDAVGTGANEISFRFSASGTSDELKQALTNLERSIRAIDVTSLRIESQGTNQVLTIEARAFYEPAVVVELKDKLVKP